MALTLGRTRIAADFGFFAVMAFLWMSTQREVLLLTLLVSFLHECGHGLAMLCVRAGLREVRLGAWGIRMQTNTALLTTRELLLIYLAGPAVNLLCALCWPEEEGRLLHLCMGAFNLLPFAALDGGSALRLLTDRHPKAETARRIGCMFLVTVSIPVLGLCGVHNPALLLVLAVLAISEASLSIQNIYLFGGG